MDCLCRDIIITIAQNLNLQDILNFSIINREILNIFDENFFFNLAIKYYSHDFWHKASKRPKHISCPLNSMKLELIRIENFQNILISFRLPRWRELEFYKYWELKNKISKKIYC